MPGWCSKSHRGSRIFLVMQQTMSFILWVSHKGMSTRKVAQGTFGEYMRILCMLYFYPRLSTFQTLDICNHIPSDRNMPNKFASRSFSWLYFPPSLEPKLSNMSTIFTAPICSWYWIATCQTSQSAIDGSSSLGLLRENLPILYCVIAIKMGIKVVICTLSTLYHKPTRC